MTDAAKNLLATIRDLYKNCGAKTYYTGVVRVEECVAAEELVKLSLLVKVASHTYSLALHPAFVANICGTLIAHPEHDGVTRKFAACPTCKGVI